MRATIVMVGMALMLLINATSVNGQPATSVQTGQATVAAASQVVLGTLAGTSAARPSAGAMPIPLLTGTSAADYDAAKARASQRGAAPSGILPAPPAVPTITTPGASRAFFPFDTNEESRCGFIPSDMALTASLGFVVQVNNACITVLDPVAGQLIQADLRAFFGVPATDGVGDPRAFYDPNADRFVVIAEDFTPNPALLMLAASQSGDPTAGWNVYTFNMGAAGQCGDFPTLGQTLKESGDPLGGIYVGFNTFMCAPPGTFQGSTVFYLPKSPIYAGAGFSFNFAFNFNVGGVQVDTLQPANVWNATDRPRAEFLINSFDFNFGGGLCRNGCNGLVVWAVANGVPGPGQTTVTTGFVVGTANTYFLSSNAPQPGCPGGACLINTGTPNISGMVPYAAGSLYAALTNNKGVQLFEVHPTLDDNAAITGVVIRNEVCFACGGFGGGGQAYYPAIQPDSEGNFTLVYNFSDPSTFPGTAYLSRRVTQAQNTVRDSGFFLATGQGFYQQLDQFGRNRWGDYTAAAASLLNPPSYWFSGMFSEANGLWGTAIGLNGFTDPSQP